VAGFPILVHYLEVHAAVGKSNGDPLAEIVLSIGWGSNLDD
jgi:hypothetical protein